MLAPRTRQSEETTDQRLYRELMELITSADGFIAKRMKERQHIADLLEEVRARLQA